MARGASASLSHQLFGTSVSESWLELLAMWRGRRVGGGGKGW